MVHGLQLVDVWKAIRKDEPGWTFSYSGGQAQLDRIYATETLKFVDAFTHTLPFGDHSALASRVGEDSASQQHQRLYRLNTSSLDEHDYCDLFHEFLAEISSYPSRHEDVGYWWESVFKPGLK